MITIAALWIDRKYDKGLFPLYIGTVILDFTGMILTELVIQTL